MKNRHITKRDIHRLATGETDARETAAMNTHLASCPECQEEFSRTEKLFKKLEQLPRFRPREESLQRSRIRLFRSLRSDSDSMPAANRFEKIAALILGPGPSLKIVSAVTIFIMGIFLGQLIDFSAGHDYNGDSAAQLGYVESIIYDNSSLQQPVNITIRENRTHTLAAAPTDPRIIDAVIHILETEERDDMRIKAVKILQNSGESDKVRMALLDRLKKDSNPGIRLMAIKLLKKFPINEKIKETLVSTFFTDKNSGIRYEAKEILKTLPENPVKNFDQTT